MGVGKPQVKKDIRPIVLDYDQTNLRLNVVDRSFLIWLSNQDREDLPTSRDSRLNETPTNASSRTQNNALLRYKVFPPVMPSMAHRMRTKKPVDPREVQVGSDAFRVHEKRDAIYKVSTFLVDHVWGDPPQMADALGVLLLVWNNAFYRYGPFDYVALENTLRTNMDGLNKFRKRDIETFGREDEESITALFAAFLDGLAIAEGKSKGRRSPVGVAKALHLLAPGFFPLWDDKIAKGYRCHYSRDPSGQYLRFMKISKGMAESLRGKVETQGSTLLKVIDEYNYAKFTKKWI
ncbi:hypothetical protein ACFL0Q_02215 [Thermodesulfobacteriota bacterium]